MDTLSQADKSWLASQAIFFLVAVLLGVFVAQTREGYVATAILGALSLTEVLCIVYKIFQSSDGNDS